MTLAAPETRRAIDCAGRSHVGLVRPENEDAFGLVPDRAIAVVADGMGGHQFGRQAADYTVGAICRITPAADLAGSIEHAQEVLARTNREVWHRSQEMRTTMGATFVVAIVDRSRVGILWAGDSRAYLLRDGNLYCLTRDHGAVQQLMDSGHINMFEVFEHPMRHVVTRAIGVAAELRVDTGHHAITTGDILLLSTDGLHGAVSDEDIRRCLNRHGLDALDQLIGLALQAGGRDNVTVVLMRF